MVDNDDGQGVGALKLTKKSEDAGDLPGIVLVDSVQTDKWVEQQQARPKVSEGRIEAPLVVLEVEAQARGSDHVQRDASQVELAVVTERAEALLDEVG